MAQDTSLNPLMKPAVKFSNLDSTAAAYTLTTGGVYSSSTLSSLPALETFNAQTATLGFVGTGLDNGAYTIQIWSAVPVVDATGVGDTHYYVQSVGVATCALSTSVASTGTTIFPATYRCVDTIAWTPAGTGTTPAGNYTDLCTALGAGTGTFSNFTNLPATLVLPLAGQCGRLLFDFKLGANTTSMNGFGQANVV